MIMLPEQFRSMKIKDPSGCWEKVKGETSTWVVALTKFFAIRCIYFTSQVNKSSVQQKMFIYLIQYCI